MKKVTTFLALMLVQHSYAVQLEGMNGVDILAIDGQTIKSNLFSQEMNELNAGKHQIVVRYSKKFTNKKLLSSRPAIFTIDIQQDTQISASATHNYMQAKQTLRKGITWSVSSTDKQYKVSNSDTLISEGFMPYANITRLVKEYNQTHNITSTGAKKALSKIGMGLIDAYQQASLTDKKAFRLWLLEQDMK